jgi:hypothetical protein
MAKLSDDFILQYYDAATNPNTKVWLDDFDDMTIKLFGPQYGKQGLPPDVDMYLKKLKKNPNGAQLFLKYIKAERPKGNYYFSPEKQVFQRKDGSIPKNESMKNIKELLRPLIKEILDESKLPIKEADITKPLFTAPTLDGNTFIVVSSGRIKDGEDKFKMLVVDKNKNIVKDWGTHPMLKGAIQLAKNKKIIENTIIKEAVKGLNLEQPHSNLYIKGWGRDKNGNTVILVGFPNDKGWAIQTNGTLPETDWTIKRAHKELSDEELDIIGQEVTDYVSQYGSKEQKARLKRYNRQ